MSEERHALTVAVLLALIAALVAVDVALGLLALLR